MNGIGTSGICAPDGWISSGSGCRAIRSAPAAATPIAFSRPAVPTRPRGGRADCRARRAPRRAAANGRDTARRVHGGPGRGASRRRAARSGAAGVARPPARRRACRCSKVGTVRGGGSTPRRRAESRPAEHVAGAPPRRQATPRAASGTGENDAAAHGNSDRIRRSGRMIAAGERLSDSACGQGDAWPRSSRAVPRFAFLAPQ